ncbi:CBR-PQN-89 protein [Ditylenchus destructor]|uniref:CBR-PQN-89 protein n=1 Tax=Ditylenchus destructor TaxID=166010 RepID=A0AAD4MZT1_9BILA|nr:CBR-PQN-89 protein [Ditylenchus destructor]
MLPVALLLLILNQVNAYEYPVSDKLASASDRVAGAIAQVPGMSGIVGPSNVAGGQQQQQRNYGGGYYESNPHSGVNDQSQLGMQQPQQQEHPYNSVSSGLWGVQNQTQRPQDLFGRQNPNNPWENRGVSVQVQLRSYRNQDFRIDRERLCTCPPGNMRCIESSPTRSGYTCLVSFTVIVSSADSSVQYRSTPYVPLNQYGNVQPEYMPSIQQIMDFQLENQPTAVDVFVHNLGAVINAQTGIIEQSNTVTHIDTFVKGLNETLPSQTTGAISGQQQQANLVGTLLGTQLSLTYSVSCRGRLIGPGCDLQCNSSVVNSAKSVCVNSRTGYFSLCEWTSGPNSQVARCQNCPWGIKENAYCMDERGGVLESEHAGVVSAGYQTATIILATVAGLLLLCLVASCIYNCIG